MALVLGSGSPRRRVLLRFLVDDFEVVVPDVDETLPEGPLADALQAVAVRKAKAVAAERGPDDVVLAADTLVALDDRPLGKPADADEAERMLRALSGREHTVITALAVHRDGRAATTAVTTPVRFAEVPDATVAEHRASGAWYGKAGGYGLQDASMARFITVPEGHWSNGVGLPLAATARLLQDIGVACKDPPDEAWLARHNPF